MQKTENLTTKILIFMVLGIIVGVVLNQFYHFPFVRNVLSDIIFKIGSVAFLNLVRMTIVPLVLFSITVGASQMGDVVKVGRVGGKILGLYVCTTIVAISLAIPIAYLIRPGTGFDLSNYSEVISGYTPPASGMPIIDNLLSIIPENPFASLSSANMLQIIFFAIFLGISITVLGEKASGVKKFFSEFNEIVMKIVWVVMKLAPYGVFFLAADSFTKLGFSALRPLGMYILTAFIVLFLHAIVVYGGMLKFIAKCSPIQFLKNYFPAISIAFSTASSNAALPISIDCSVNRCGIDQEVASFTIPLGATVNMDGSAITQGVATIFIAQAFGIPLDITAIIMVILTATLLTLGSPGIPGASTILLAVVFAQVGLPVEAIGMILGVDRILSMTRTMTNISGDAICSIIVAKSEGLFNQEVFDKPK